MIASPSKKHRKVWNPKFILLFIPGMTLIFTACATPETAEGPVVPVVQFNPSLSTSASAVPESESSLQLEDGAQAIIPAGALSGNAQVTLERNPLKAASLPALPAGVTQLSDFYSIDISGAELRTTYELILPFNMAAIPDNQPDGLLMAMFPTENGWDYVPVQSQGNYAFLVTDRIGDPLIGWNFKDIRTPEEKAQYLEQLKARAICSPTFAVRILPQEDGHGFTVLGRLQPARFTYLGFVPRTPAAGVAVNLYVNKNRPYRANDAIEVITDADGNFTATLLDTNLMADLHQGYNWLRAAANCDAWPGEVSVLSEGWAGGNLAAAGEQGASAQLPVLMPADNRVLVTIPEVVGMTKDEAVERLLDAGVMVALGSGVSTYDVGVVFRQDPAAGSLVDPYEVTVLIYVTSEQSGPASLLQRFGRAVYTCTSYVGHSYTWDTPTVTEGCGSMTYRVENASGELEGTLVSRDGSTRSYTAANLADGLPTRPIGALTDMGVQFWWIPDTTQSYTYPGWTNTENYSEYTRVDSQSDFTLTPGVTSVITIAGRSFDAITYTAEYTGDFRETWNAGVYEYQVFYYKIVDTFDRVSGILLRSESYSTWGPCSTDNKSSPICMSGAMTGRTSSIIMELTEIDMP